MNRKSSKKPIPKQLVGIYDDKKYAKSQAYQAELSKFGILTSSFSFILTFSAIYFGWFGLLDEWIRTFSPLNLVSPLIF
ncbi:MAG: M48 family peptidase, partial [Bacteroidota bacterium]